MSHDDILAPRYHHCQTQTAGIVTVLPWLRGMYMLMERRSGRYRSNEGSLSDEVFDNQLYPSGTRPFPGFTCIPYLDTRLPSQLFEILKRDGLVITKMLDAEHAAALKALVTSFEGDGDVQARVSQDTRDHIRHNNPSHPPQRGRWEHRTLTLDGWRRKGSRCRPNDGQVSRLIRALLTTRERPGPTSCLHALARRREGDARSHATLHNLITTRTSDNHTLLVLFLQVFKGSWTVFNRKRVHFVPKFAVP